MLLEDLKNYTFRELKLELKKLRIKLREARTSERDVYFEIYNDISKITFKMRNVIRQKKKLKVKLKD